MNTCVHNLYVRKKKIETLDVNLNAKVNTQVFGLYFVPAHNHKLYSVSKDRDTHGS